MSDYTPWIVCAANRHHDTGLIICGARHWDDVMRAVAKAVYPTPDHLIHVKPPYGSFDQGFIDQRGKWYTRTEAWTVAMANGQVKRRVGGDETDGGTLYSEGLY